ncbi:hypothetical protein EJ02DRAFT_489193 [Clathrospora elynae]|uniref:RapZ C-terminal domain-containing protein n=1 Tax=Clathrospora elynae TaxID=706981 RepID=A0A6A5SS81_9PLEO|nr:hypothetical protein EJ02DRAFT_489193 [Clathrospora elynae]
MFPIHSHMQMMSLQPVMFPQPQLLIPFQPVLFPLQHPHPFLQSQPLPNPYPQPLLQPATHAKTVYILSYSSEVIKRTPGAQAKLQTLCPGGIPALLTVNCQTWRAPLPDACRNCSGVNPVVQGYVLQSRTAVEEIDKAVTSLVNHLNAGNAVASIQTTCHAGTHRSVAAADIIAQKIRRRRVHAVVRHAHRKRGPGDLR